MVPTIESREYTQHPFLYCKYHPFHRFTILVRKLNSIYESSRRKQIATRFCCGEGTCQECSFHCSDHRCNRNRADSGRTFSGRSFEFSSQCLWKLQGLRQFTTSARSRRNHFRAENNRSSTSAAFP